MLTVLLGATAGMAYLSKREATPPAKPLSDFPTQIAGFKAFADFPLEQRFIDALGVTDYLNRGYFSPSEGQLGLYIGYFRSQRTGASIHSPKNCLPGSGWQPEEATVYELPLDDGRKVPINLYIVRKGLDEQLVLYWYQAHGRVVASEYWGKVYLVWDALRSHRRDGAIVRITVPMVSPNDSGAAQSTALDLARAAVPDLPGFLPK